MSQTEDDVEAKRTRNALIFVVLLFVVLFLIFNLLLELTKSGPHFDERYNGTITAIYKTNDAVVTAVASTLTAKVGISLTP